MQSGRDRQRGFAIDGDKKEKKEFTPVAPGSYTSAAIIMLTDGQRTTGVDPLEAAKMAADRGVRVYTVGIGTVDGETIGFEGWSMRVRLDEETLKAIANKTSAEYYYAGTAADLKKVYETLSSRLTVEKKETEVSALVALAAAALALLSAGLSLLWFNRILVARCHRGSASRSPWPAKSCRWRPRLVGRGRALQPNARSQASSVQPRRQPQLPPAARRQLLVVRHQHESRAALARQLQHQLEHASAVLRSRLPVGSSASTQAGCVTSARAIATRWRSPPDSSAGRCRRRSARPTAASVLRGLARALLHRLAPDAQRHAHVVQRAELGQQVVELVDEAQVLVAQPRPARPRPAGDIPGP